MSAKRVLPWGWNSAKRTVWRSGQSVFGVLRVGAWGPEGVWRGCPRTVNHPWVSLQAIATDIRDNLREKQAQLIAHSAEG